MQQKRRNSPLDELIRRDKKKIIKRESFIIKDFFNALLLLVLLNYKR